MPEKIDIALISLCLSKDREAQRKLYDLLLPYLTVICRRYLNSSADLNDVLQETFVNIFRNLEQFDLRRASFKTWTTRIAINACLKNKQKKRRHHTEELIIDLHEQQIDPAFLDQLTNKELLTWLRKMPAPYFEVFNLFVIDGFSHQEIAELLGIDAALSRKRLSRAREWIKKRLASGSLQGFRAHLN